MQRCAYFLEVFQNTISSFHCGQISVRNPTRDTLSRPLKASEIDKHCVKSVLIRSCSGPYFPAFWLNTERYEVQTKFFMQTKFSLWKTKWIRFSYSGFVFLLFLFCFYLFCLYILKSCFRQVGSCLLLLYIVLTLCFYMVRKQKRTKHAREAKFMKLWTRNITSNII